MFLLQEIVISYEYLFLILRNNYYPL